MGRVTVSSNSSGPAVVHRSAEKWKSLAHRLPYLSLGVLCANIDWFFRRPFRYVSTFFRAVLENVTCPNYLVRMLALFPKSVYAASLMQVEGIQHVHAHYASHPALAAWIIHRLTGITYSITAHAQSRNRQSQRTDASRPPLDSLQRGHD